MDTTLVQAGGIALQIAMGVSLAATAGLVLGLAASSSFAPAQAADDTIKVGILHSLSGTMAISETTLKDTILFLIDEQNKKGGVLGKKLEAVVVDPASNWPLFAEKARELITKNKVAVVFGCWTSVSRKSVLPVFKELNKGEAITSGLRKVTDDMKSKNRADRSGLVATGGGAGVAPAVAAVTNVSKTAKPPKFALDGKKWAVEHQVGNRTLVIEDVNPKQTVYVYDCVDCVIQIKGKANNITLDKCAKTGVVFEDVLATCELVNCVSMQVQCTGAVPTVAIDKVDGCQVFLGPKSYGAEITTAKCSEVNVVCVPEEGSDADAVETPVPEQFVTTRDPGTGKWVTVPMGHSGA